MRESWHVLGVEGVQRIIRAVSKGLKLSNCSRVECEVY